MTRVCPWNCHFCCVNAFHASKDKKSKIHIKAKGYKDCFSIPRDSRKNTIYELASKRLQERKLELTFKDKLKVIENLKGITPIIDFSGGDPLLIKENIKVIKKAADLFGKKRISITATGVGFANSNINEFSDSIGEVEFTYDNITDKDNTHKQKGYNKINLLQAKKLTNKNFRVKALVPLSTTNTEPEIIKNIYLNLHKIQVDQILLMRIFPVGRGMLHSLDLLKKQEYLKAIKRYFKLEKKFGKPKIVLQCALKGLYFKKLKYNPCNLLSSSLGITSNGLLLLSPWAYNAEGKPMTKDFIIGDLTKENIVDIYRKKRVKKMLKKVNNNFGHCKMFAYLNSKEKDINQLFSKNDPFYKKKQEV